MRLDQTDYAALRRDMVDRQLRDRGIQDQRVLEAMQWAPREAFVPPGFRWRAYEDCALPIDCDQTISQPYTVAFMLEALQLRGDERVLEIGAGSGYNAALLSRLAKEVDSVERIEELAVEARRRLAELGCDNVRVRVGDGSRGLPDRAPFDAIIVTAGAERLPAAYQDQLVDGGRILIPIGPRRCQTMTLFTKSNGELTAEHLGAFAFVPLISDSPEAP